MPRKEGMEAEQGAKLENLKGSRYGAQGHGQSNTKSHLQENGPRSGEPSGSGKA